MKNIITEGEILREEIRKSRFTQEEFASEMGFSRGYLVRLMERAELPEDVKQKACKILKIDMATTFGVQNTPQIGEQEENETLKARYVTLLEEALALMKMENQRLREENEVLKNRKATS